MGMISLHAYVRQDYTCVAHAAMGVMFHHHTCRNELHHRKTYIGGGLQIVK